MTPIDRANASLLAVQMLLAIPIVVATVPGVANAACSRNAVAVEPGASIQAAVDGAGDGATLCLKNGIHRMQVIRPRPGQRFHGEDQTILNGSRLLTKFSREERYWVTHQEPLGRRHGEDRCAKATPTCNLPEVLFIDDQPLVQVLNKDEVRAGRFYFDRANARIYLADDPTDRKVEITLAAFAFESGAPDVLIENVTVEKYANAPQKGAIQARGVRWTIENCELRLNNGAGIVAGRSTRVRGCNIHHNGQLGAGGNGQDIVLEGNKIWANNTRGFEQDWEAGGVKIVLGDDVVLRNNYVHDNFGRGLWCDGDCRNVLYEENLVERNEGFGIFHEISYNAVIRNNIVRHNAAAEKEWGSEILLAASQDVEIYGNTLAVSSGKCGIMLVDQGRNDHRPGYKGPIYKTRNNKINDNEMSFEGAACAGGASEVEPGHENFSIITDGNNVFDRNVYRVPRTNGSARFPWGHETLNWDDLRRKGVEPNGRLELY